MSPSDCKIYEHKMSTVKSYFYVTRSTNFIFKENAELNNTVATIDAWVK